MAEEIKPNQDRLVALLDEYETAVSPARGERNAAYTAFEKDWKDKWAGVESGLAQARAEIQAKLEAEGIDPSLRASIEAKEMAAITEKHETAKQQAATKLEEVLPRPQSWLEFLQERQKESPDDPELSTLIEEARQSPDPGIGGKSLVPAPQIVLNDLQHVVKDGQVHYRRGLWTAVKDTGDRLDVMRMDDRDIEAAMKIAAQKFDKEQPLVLTGDPEFKVRAARTAARMGLKIANTEPAVVQAYQAELKRVADAQRTQIPAKELMSIKGQEKVQERDGPVIFRAEQGWKEVAKENGCQLTGVDQDEQVVMEADRFSAAVQATRTLSDAALKTLEQADPAQGASKQYGLDADKLTILEVEDSSLVAGGNLTREALDVLAVMSSNRIEHGTSRAPKQEQAQAVEQARTDQEQEQGQPDPAEEPEKKKERKAWPPARGIGDREPEHEMDIGR